MASSAKPWNSVNMMVVMFLLIWVSWVVSGAPAPDCNTASKYLTPCSNYLTKGSPLPKINDPCCQGVRRLYKQGATQQERQQICQCLKNSATNLKLNDKAVASLAPDSLKRYISTQLSHTY
ncbi:non-specific lipid-transfer protein 6-like [Cryptomeria japonica]|uniref:non-specific lipid-transfer protein 6-like n=1 Tax=Cryptomeria japonica TaxID=3369 RepID=UPI0025ACC5CA|nr:non-specific lipid-transfer protein 6-like [Cryptomeria japonica]